MLFAGVCISVSGSMGVAEPAAQISGAAVNAKTIRFMTISLLCPSPIASGRARHSLR